MIELKREKMASSSADVPYNHPTENVLFGQNVIEKISDTCLGQDGKRYYQVKWRDSWEPEERLMTACEGALQAFWKEYYTNVEKEIRKQVITASITTSKNGLPASMSSVVDAGSIQILQHTPQQQPSQSALGTGPGAVVHPNVVENFPEQSSNVAYYAVQDNIEINSDNTLASVTGDPMNKATLEEGNVITQDTETAEINEQAQLLTHMISSSAPSMATKWSADKDLSPNRRTLTTITADTLNTKSVGGPDANSKFHCDICFKTFVSKRNVQRHMLSHTGEKPWMCEYCFKRFRQKPHLEQHVNIHKGIKNSVCNICRKAFNHRSNLVTHMATHSNVRPHTCQVCGENFKLKHTLAKHMMVHSKLDTHKRHQCKECKRSFRDKSYLIEHETIHKKEKPYQCDVCMKSFSFKRRYQMHLEVHRASDGGDEYVCHICPKTFKSKVYLQKHLERHENKRKKKKKRNKEKDGEDGAAEGNSEMDGQEGDNDSPGENDDVDLSMSEVDVKAEGELEEGETIPRLQHTNLQQQTTNLQNNATTDLSTDGTQIIHIERSGESDPNMVVTSMLPMSTLNMEDPATYVALAQLTQAAIESAPMEDSENVILMSYEDIQKSIQEMQNSEGEPNQEINLDNIQIAQQQVQDGVATTSSMGQVQQQQLVDSGEDFSQVQMDNSVMNDSSMSIVDAQGDVSVPPS